jgi:hypothetical protein
MKVFGRKMLRSYWFYALVPALSVLFIIYVIYIRTTTIASFDNMMIGKTEEDVIRRYGLPKEKFVRPARNMGGELRFEIRRIKGVSDDSMIKELYYEDSSGEKIFWLQENTSNAWCVVSDVKIPKGVVF